MLKKSHFSHYLYSVLLVLILNVSSALGQNQDSLLGIWNDQSETDEIRMEALVDAVSSLLTSDPEQSNELAKIGRDFAIEVEQPSVELKFLVLLSQSEYMLGHYESALVRARQGIELGQDLPNNTEYPQIIRVAGLIYEAQGLNQYAEEHYLQALQLARSLGDSVTVSRCLNSLGIFYETVVGEYNQALDFYTESLKIKEEFGNKLSIGITIYNIARVYYLQGDLTTSIQQYLEALAIFEEIEDIIGIQDVYTSVGNIFEIQNDYKQAISYYRQSLSLSKQTGDRLAQSLADLNLGNTYLELGDYERAEAHLDSSYQMLLQLDHKVYLPHIYYSLGELAHRRNEYNKALNWLLLGDALSNESEPDQASVETDILLAKIYLDQGAVGKGGQILQIGLKNAQLLGNPELEMRAQQQISTYYERLGSEKRALHHFKKYIKLKDSLVNEQTIRETMRQDMEYSFEKQQLADSLEFAKQQALKDAQLAKERTQRNLLGLGLIIFVMLSGLIYYQYMQTTKARKQSDKLLLNILPKDTAEELKNSGKTTAKRYDQVTVIISDFAQFSKIAEALTAETLIAELDLIFGKFDDICLQYGLEKIKTTGDAYMAVAGMPESNQSTVVDALNAALEMQSFIGQLQSEDHPPFKMRLGIHTGNLVAGVVGSRKFLYDIWGETVNIASRMESHGILDEVNISEETYGLVAANEDFSFERRPPSEVKSLGTTQMYLVKKRKVYSV